ncbi:hypothetical protein KUCAC02_033570 [Chaenocephalus aceratus]|nr:hypothetical protein KUCAC02_033570 [Chaenocephalus aceratus]
MVHDDTEQVLSELQRSVERLQELLEEVLDQASTQKMGTLRKSRTAWRRRSQRAQEERPGDEGLVTLHASPCVIPWRPETFPLGVNDTTLFTLGDVFSGLGSRNTNSRSPAPTVGARADRRGLGIGLRIKMCGVETHHETKETRVHRDLGTDRGERKERQ